MESKSNRNLNLRDSRIKQMSEFLVKQLGKPYKFGAETPNLDEPEFLDCSELIELAFRHAGIIFPDGCSHQIKACRLLGNNEIEAFGDLGFLVDPPNTPARHVVMVWDAGKVIEARGKPFNKVMLCDKSYWLKRKGFTGWMRPRVFEV